LALSTGSKTWAVANPKAFAVGQDVRVVNTASIYMDGQITAVTSTSITVTVAAASGSGTYASWTFTVYPRVLAKFFPTSAAPMPTAKSEHAAASLPDGRVLVCGGNYLNSSLGDYDTTAEAHIHNPVTNTWAAVASMPASKQSAAAASLSDGRVLVCGGQDINGQATSEAHIYSPTANTWTAVASMPVANAAHKAASLPDGRVLICGGLNASGSMSAAYIYNPTANTWTAVASMPTSRYHHAAAALADGRVLVCGGRSVVVPNPAVRLASAHVYNPATDTWAAVASLPKVTVNHAAASLPDGRALVCGGFTGSSAQQSVEAYVYTPAADAWTPIASTPNQSINRHAAVGLPDGRVFVCGGLTPNEADGFTSAAFAYNPTL
jgi:N-acetylneuraminic acid mutarotase